MSHKEINEKIGAKLNKEISVKIKDAKKDFRYLINRGYKKDYALNVVSDLLQRVNSLGSRLR
ncbi:DUF434 domain-containing protein [Methanothermococcus sp. Ax23]|uniref:DUF434 domain-containing protein n=1 Tax=Methanothermococcus sp. Ax23 TaxID=3156486 RepID=UPI003B9DFEEA